MSNPCRICVNPEWAEQARIWGTTGVADREVARRLGVDKSLVTRHRRRHVLVPMQQQIALIEKGDEARRERAQIAEALAADAPSTAALVAAHLSLQAQVKKLEIIEARLERMAVQAEAGGSPAGVAVLSAQALRGVEVGSRLAGIGAYAPPRSPTQPAYVPNRFAVNIVFSGAGRTETIALASAPPADIGSDVSEGGVLEGSVEPGEGREDER